MTLTLTPAESARYQSKYEPSGDCLLWRGSLDKDGYGMFHFRGANRRAHRFAYVLTHGPIPDGYHVNHTCRQRSCVNPQHLKAVTPYENIMADSTSLPYINSQKTHCPRGHEYDKTVNWGGRRKQRVCMTCTRELDRAKKKRRYQEAVTKYRI